MMKNSVEYTIFLFRKKKKTRKKDVIKVLSAIPDAISVNLIQIQLSKNAVCVLKTAHVHVNETWTLV